MNKTLVLLLVIVGIGSACSDRARVVEGPDSRRAVPKQSEVSALKTLAPSKDWVITASSEEESFAAALAVDGNPDTRWASSFADNQWLLVDFGKPEQLGSLAIDWEDACARSYRVLASEDGEQWSELFSEQRGSGGRDEIVFEPRAVRQVKIELITRATEWGFSIFEVSFNPSLSAPLSMQASASSGTGDYGAGNAIDGDMKTRWSSDFSDDAWWQVKFSEPRTIGGVKILWETAFSEKYDVQTSIDGDTWTTVYSVAEGDGRTDLLFFEPIEAQYLRIACRQRGTGWGNSIWEVDLFHDGNLPSLSASSSAEGQPASAAMDGRLDTGWRSEGDGEQILAILLPETTELGGVFLQWLDDHAIEYEIQTSLDGNEWSSAALEKDGNGAGDYHFFAARKARQVRFICRRSSADNGYSLAWIEFKGGEEQATPIRAYQAKSRDSKLGRYPMWLNRQQEFWTVTGIPGDDHETLLGETGMVEPRKGDFGVMPFVIDRDGVMIDWADVKLEQSLADGHLPLPTAGWRYGDEWNLDITAVAFGEVNRCSTAVRYRFTNKGDTPFSGKLALAIRPVTLNPGWQHGGFSPMKTVRCTSKPGRAGLIVNDRMRVFFATEPAGLGAAALKDGDVSEYLARGEAPPALEASDREGRTGAGALFDLQAAPGQRVDVVVVYLLHDESKVPVAFGEDGRKAFDAVLSVQRTMWSELLAVPRIEIPEKRLIDVMKSNLGYVLVNRDGPWFKPGPRNYNHSWMRDGALTGVATLRCGMPGLVREFISTFSGFIADNGWVPWMVLENGSPVSFNADPNSGEGHEYDSQGEYAFIVRQYYDYTGDEDLVREVYPKVVSALRFGQEIRRRRMTDEYRNDPDKQAYFGVLPESNSHEGYYPAKHSYWDNFWMLRGYKDGAALADRLGFPEDAKWMREEEDAMRADVYASIMQVIRRGNMQVIPGCVELGDIDPTSTSVAIMACDEGDHLPQPHGTNTFDFYWNHFTRRLQPGGEETFTPYEARNADVFVRLGWRDRALSVLRHFTSDSTRPHNWNHMAEVVHAKSRAPSYIGDMPHTWVGSDYINAVRSIFGYEDGDKLIVAAGVDPAWLRRGVLVETFPTQFGIVNYTMNRAGDNLLVSVTGNAAPPGGFVLPLPSSLDIVSVEVNEEACEISHRIVFRDLPVSARIGLK